MKTIAKLSGILLLAFVIFQCSSDEEVIPQTEAQKKPNYSDTLNIKSSSSNADKLSVIGDKSNETKNGYDVYGAVYLDTDSGKVAIVDEARFTVHQDAQGNLKSIEGTGPVQLPDMGMFKSFNFIESAEAAFVYNTGKYFKDTNSNFEAFPLQDTSYYFFFNLINLASGESKEMRVRNANIGVTSFFMNLPQQEFVLSTGKFEIETPEGPIGVGSELIVGISGKGSFAFAPQVYADSALNAIMAKQKAFSDISGFLYLSGEISLGNKVPMKLEGNAVVSGDFNEIFSNGFSRASYVFAMNGSLVFGHDLLDLMPVDVDTKLTNVTVRIEETLENGKSENMGLKFAGDFDDNAWMETIIDAIGGKGASQYVPLTGNEGSMFASFGKDWEVYIKAAFAINTIVLGKHEARHGMIHVDSEKVKISGGLALPFITGEVNTSGEISYSGGIHLKGEAKEGLDIEGVKLKSNLNMDITNDAATLTGNIEIPYGLGQADVNGKIDKNGLKFSGNMGNRQMQFGQGVMVPLGDLTVSVEITNKKQELALAGAMFLPQLDKNMIEVAGRINNLGAEFTGSFSTNLNMVRGSIFRTALPLVDMNLTARTWEGVKFKGGMSLPFGIATVDAHGYLTALNDRGYPEIMMVADFSSDPTLRIEGFPFPTSGFHLSASSMNGISFGGQIKFNENIGFVDMNGKIVQNAISLSGEANKNIKFGGNTYYSELKFSASSLSYPNIASISGKIHTVFGKVDADGVIGLNGNFKFTGSLEACGSVKIVKTFSGMARKNFEFRNAGITLGASGKACLNDCENASDCTEVGVSTSIDWENGKFEVCVPIPIYGDLCL